MSSNFVCVDCGASSTRYVSTAGNIDILSNNMVMIEQSADVTMENYEETITDALDVTIESSHKNNHFPCRVLVGTLAERYDKNNIRPNAMTNKTTQTTTYISIVLATALKRLRENLSDDIELYITLPPVEAKWSYQTAIETLVGSYTVKFNQFENKEVRFNITKVNVFAESYMSLMSFFFNMNGAARDEVKAYRDGIVLSLDIGASTTDLAICKNKKYLDKSGYTIKAGGNITRSHFQEQIKGKYGYDITIEGSEKAIAEGRLQIGNTFVECGEEVNFAKSQLADTIVNEIQSYFGNVGIPPQEIKAVCVSGGGSLAGMYLNDEGEFVQTSRPVSDFIMDKLHSICPAVEVIPYGEESRLANIKGLFIRANIAIMIAERTAKASATVKE